MSFTLTERQIRDRSKTVTRRLGWKCLRPGDRIQAVRKSMGLRKGEKVERLAVLRVVDVRREPLNQIDPDDVEREGFPGRSRMWFVQHFCQSMRCQPFTNITRIEFAYE